MVLIGLTVAATAVYGYFQFRTDLFTETLKTGEQFSILLVITRDDALDFMELLVYNPETKRAGLFHIPANLGTQIPELDRYDRLAVLYQAGATDTLRKKTEAILGTGIPFTLALSYANLARAVDLLGGVELFISNPVDVGTDSQRVLLPSGSVLLDGDKTIQYLTYLEPLEQEMEQVGRKQKLIQAFLRRAGQPAGQAILAHGETAGLFRELFDTNISPRGMAALVQELGRMDADRLIFQRVMGNTRDVEGVSKPVLLPHYEGVLIRETVAQIAEAIRHVEADFEETLTVTVEILNGTSVDGLARRTKALFESYGFDVVAFSNADSDKYLNTIVLDRRGKHEAARRVAEVIHCERIHVREEAGAEADVTIILGRDFDGRYVKG